MRFTSPAPLELRRMAAFAFVLAFSFAFASVASAQTPRPILGTNNSVVSEHATSGRAVLEFHSGFWINLHHFLYAEARLRAGESLVEGGGATAPSIAFENDPSPQWTTALDYYAAHFIHRDLLLDYQLVAIEDALTQFEACPDLTGRSSTSCNAGLPAQLAAVLERAAPNYRARWWPQHDRQNRIWIASVAPLIRELGTTLSTDLAGIYKSAWPAAPIPVDVAIYAGPFGAYTSLDPVHITVSSADLRNTGLEGFEVVFHEASHSLAAPVSDLIIADCRALNKPVPRDLWHALLFYTTGVLVERALGSMQPASSSGANRSSGTALASPTYVPYAIRNGLYERDWQAYQSALVQAWQPYLDGHASFRGAILNLVQAL
jgi:hypothetical protein